jgi:tellurite methyltransferase
MFEPNQYHLFRELDLDQCFNKWGIVKSRIDSFPAPGATVKRFATIIARRLEA